MMIHESICGIAQFVDEPIHMNHLRIQVPKASTCTGLILKPLPLKWHHFPWHGAVARGEVSLQCEVPRSIQCDFWPAGPPSWDDKGVTFPAVM